jgi:hypothetical protein
MDRTISIVAAAALLAMAVIGAGCSKKETAEPPVATPTFTPGKTRVALGSPLEITYKFVVAPGAKFDKNYRVMVHFLDSDDEQMWTDDHEPPTPTTQWKPGDTIEYKRTLFVPAYPYLGQATVRVGLYADDGKRASLNGQDKGRREYQVATLDLVSQTENVFLIYKDGWHASEVTTENSPIQTDWQWTKRNAVLTFKNPKRDVWFYLNLDGRPDFLGQPQTVTVTAGDQQIDQFTISDLTRVLRKVPVTAAQLGGADMAEIKIDAGASFVPAQVPAAKSADGRELGVRVFHAFVEPQK